MTNHNFSNTKGAAELKGLSLVEALLSEGKLDEAREKLDEYIEQNGTNEEANIVKLALLFESETLYKVLLLGLNERFPIPYVDSEHRARVQGRTKEILATANALTDTLRDKLYVAVGSFIEYAVLAQSDITRADALTFLYGFLPVLKGYTFPALSTGKYTSVAERIFLPKDKRFTEIEELALARIEENNAAMFAQETQALGALYLEAGNYTKAKEYLDLSLKSIRNADKHKTLFLLLCLELHASGEEEFIKAKGFREDHPLYESLLASVKTNNALTRKYKELAEANIKAHTKKPRKPRKQIDWKKIGLQVGVPVGAVTVLCLLFFVVLAGRLVYKEMPNGSGYAVAYRGIAYTKRIEIPAEYNGEPVVKVEDKAFRGKKNIETVVLPDTIETIGDLAFAGCSNLVSITLPDKVDSLGDGAFQKCKSLTSINIPYGVDRIHETTFFKCKRLKKFEVDGGNRYYQSIGGNLYTASGETLVQYAIGQTEDTFTVPDGVTRIDTKAFYGAKYLKHVTLPNTLYTIDDNAFQKCKRLEDINIPSSVYHINKDAFRGCSRLRSVRFADTSGWYTKTETSLAVKIYLMNSTLSNSQTAATYLRVNYVMSNWTKE